jgi:hypothetical protein
MPIIVGLSLTRENVSVPSSLKTSIPIINSQNPKSISLNNFLLPSMRSMTPTRYWEIGGRIIKFLLTYP